MKNVSFMLAVISAVLFGTIFTSCDSAATKSSKADAKVTDAKADLKQAETTADAAAIKAANAAAWSTFKAESELRIKENEATIATLKTGMRKSDKKLQEIYMNTIAELEKKNENMKVRMTEYDKGQTEWESFKREFSHDMDGLGEALKDLGLNNKK